MYKDIAACIADALPDESLRQWVSETALTFWEGDTDALQNDGSLVSDKIEGMCLKDVPLCTMYGIIPSTLTTMLAALIARAPGEIGAKTKETARRIGQKSTT